MAGKSPLEWLAVRNWSSISSTTIKRWRTNEKFFRSRAAGRGSVGSKILTIRGWRELADPAELPVEVGKVR